MFNQFPFNFARACVAYVMLRTLMVEPLNQCCPSATQNRLILVS